MATTIQIKRSSTASGVPLATDLAVGELAVNLADKRLFTKQSDGTIIELSTNPTDLDAATLRIDGVEITASATELNKLDGFTGSTTELNILDGLTATTIELNTLDGITASTAELNKLDGYTGSTAELNILDGVTATTAELNFVDGVTSNIQTQLNNKQPLDAQLTDVAGLTPADGSFIVGNGTNFVAESGNTAIASLGVTATAAELNTLDGITSTTAELNILDGVTATATEINVLDGITASTAELNYTDGVTSNIQTQLNGKATTAQGALADSAVQPNDNVSFGTGDFSGDVDVTGTITADGLTVDGSTTLDSGSATPLVITRSGGTSGNVGLKFDAPTSDFYAGVASTSEDFVIGWNANLNTRNGIRVTDGGDVSFYEDTGTTAKMVWDASAESLGIGTASPTAALEVLNGTGDGEVVVFSGTDSDRGLSISTFSQGGYGQVGVDLNAQYSLSSTMTLSTNGTERMRIDSSGNVGIGTASPVGTLTLKGAVGTNGIAQGLGLVYSNGTQFGALGLNNSSGWPQLMARSGAGITFHTNSDLYTSSERARLDSSGNLLVGTTNSAPYASSTETGAKIFNNGTLTASTSASSAILNTLNDGAIIDLRKDGSTVGSIGSHGGADVYVGTSDTGIRFNSASNSVTPYNPSSGANRSDAIDLGFSAIRYKDLYLSGGVFLGGTGAANKLDDYEEGTWTPVIEGSTTAGDYSNKIRAGWYTKVGRMVTMNGYFYGTSGTGSGDFIITNLPFTVDTNTSNISGTIQANNSLDFPDGTITAPISVKSTTQLAVRCTKDNQPFVWLPYPTTADYIRFQTTYFTTQ